MIREEGMGLNLMSNFARLMVLSLCAGILAAQSQQKTFDTARRAADALIAAAASHDKAALLEIFGREGKDLVDSGDAVQDRNTLAAFVASARQKKAVIIDRQNRNRAILSVGAADWPMPVPIVRRKGRWRFDPAAGRNEILRRRIGTNELDAIQVCRGYVEAQKEYASEIRDDSGINQYAQRIFSSAGKKDGLYWENPDGTPGGPIGQTVAHAIHEGYQPKAGSGYHGYYFRVLRGQGPAAPLGRLDYVIDGLMIGGFALIAVPVEYGVSGVKTFIVSHDGIVYEKDLGPKSREIAKSIQRYNPDKTWRRTNDEWPADALERLAPASPRSSPHHGLVGERNAASMKAYRENIHLVRFKPVWRTSSPSGPL